MKVELDKRRTWPVEGNRSRDRCKKNWEILHDKKIETQLV